MIKKKPTLIDFLHDTVMNKNTKGFDDMKSNKRGKALSIVLVLAMVLGMVGCGVTAPKNEVIETITIDGVTKSLDEYCGVGNGKLPEYRWFDTKIVGMDYNPEYRNITLEVEMNGFAVVDEADKTYLYLRDTKDVFTEVYGVDGVTTEPRELMYIVFDKKEGKVEPVFYTKDVSDNEVKTEWMYGGLTVEEMKERYNLDDNYLKYELSKVVQFK